MLEIEFKIKAILKFQLFSLEKITNYLNKIMLIFIRSF